MSGSAGNIFSPPSDATSMNVLCTWHGCLGGGQKQLKKNIFEAYKDQKIINSLAASGRDFPEMMLHDAIKSSGRPCKELVDG